MRDLAEKIDPKYTAVVVVDVQKDFCSPGGYMDREGQSLDMVRAMLPTLRSFLRSAQEAGVPRVFVQANYGTDFDWYMSDSWLDRAHRVNPAGGHIEYGVCVEGSWGFELVEDLRSASASDELVIKKHRYSAFVGTELDLVLRSLRVQTLIMTGVATNVCVESTARDAFMRDYHVVMPADCCATYSIAEHEATLANIRKYFGEVIDSHVISEAWSLAISDEVARATG